MEKKIIININDLDLSKTYTYADYLSWRFTERVELIMGKIFKMGPAPSRIHQEVTGKIFNIISNNLKNKICKAYVAPFDVRLPLKDKEKDIPYTVVQPDLCVVCDLEKLDDKGCNGSPDLIVEILSPSTASKDLNEKYDLYEKARVREYWTVDAVDGAINVYLLVDGKYVPKRPYGFRQELESSIIPGLIVDLKEVFPDHLEEQVDPYDGMRI